MRRILRYVRRRFGDDASFKRLIYCAVSAGFGLCFPLLFQFFAIKAVGLGGFGRYSYLESIALMLSVVACLGIPSALRRLVSEKGASVEQKRSLFRTGLALTGLGCLLTSAGLVLWAVVQEGQIGVTTWLILAILIGTCFSRFSAAFLTANLNIAAAEISLNSVRLISLLCVPLLFLAASPGHAELITIRTFALVVVAAAGCLVTLRGFRRESPTTVTEAGAATNWKSMLRISLPMMGTTLGVNLSRRIDILMLGASTDDQTVGVYAAVSKFAMLVSVPMTIVATAMMSHFSKAYHQGDHQKEGRQLTQFLRLALLASLGIIAAVHFLGGFIWPHFSIDPKQATQIFLILSIGHVAIVMTGPAGLMLNVVGGHWFSFIALWIANGINAGLNLWLIPQYGATGAAIATTVGFIIYKISMSGFLRWKYSLQSSVV